MQRISDAFKKNNLPNSFDDENYFNVKNTQKILIKSSYKINNIITYHYDEKLAFEKLLKQVKLGKFIKHKEYVKNELKDEKLNDFIIKL